jgi:hypothetical protein
MPDPACFGQRLAAALVKAADCAARAARTC